MPGSHGSLTKAGKVRQQTPRVRGRERHSPIPIVRNKKIYISRVLNRMPAGQKDKMMRGRPGRR